MSKASKEENQSTKLGPAGRAFVAPFAAAKAAVISLGNLNSHMDIPLSNPEILVHFDEDGATVTRTEFDKAEHGQSRRFHVQVPYGSFFRYRVNRAVQQQMKINDKPEFISQRTKFLAMLDAQKSVGTRREVPKKGETEFASVPLGSKPARDSRGRFTVRSK